jgi:diguanylate cyclase (GGDEF)-like protein
MSSLRNLALRMYVATVIVAGIVALVVAELAAGSGDLLGPKPLVFVVFVVLLGVGEARPVKWLTGRDDVEITASWTFSLGLLYVAPAIGALAAVAAVSLLLEVIHRKPLHRAAFNTTQITLSLAAGAILLRVAGVHPDIWNEKSPGLWWLIVATGAGLLAVLVNGLLTSVVLALSQQLALRVVIRSTLQANVVMDMLLIGLAPVLTGVAVNSFVLVPLLLVVVMGVFQSAKVGLIHRYEATHDTLTGLPNRRLFFEQATLTLDAASANGRSAAVLLIDLDGFKEINDRLGHATGDITLREVAVRLLRHRRATDVVARLGGDEFAVLLGGVDAESAERVAWSLVHDLNQVLELDGVPLAVSGSVGLALFPDHGDDIDTLLARADAAMYRAKSSKIGLEVYDVLRDRQGPRRLGLLSELRDAMAKNELFLEYQPQIDIRSGELCGVESLVRWQHPTRGLLLPDHFIPTAEHTELIEELTERVLKLAVAQASAWRAEGLDVRVAVNASARNFLQVRFPDVVRAILAEAGLPGDRLELEITENTVTNDPDRTVAVMEGLQALGVSISIDDFGTGYSSLAHLRSLPVDRIKIDRSFVRDMVTNRDDLVIVRCIIDLAANLDLISVAEGVEDIATLELLQTLGCQYAQGYHIGRPGSADQITELARRRGVAALAPGSSASIEMSAAIERLTLDTEPMSHSIPETVSQ